MTTNGSIKSFGGNNNINVTGNNNIIGDGNTYVEQLVLDEPRFLNKTVLFQFCDIFSSQEFSESSDLELEIPSKFDEKMSYNDLNTYKIIFKECDIYYDDVENILTQFPKREKIIKKINRIYLNIITEENRLSSDSICQKISLRLIEVISQDTRSSPLEIEDVELAIEALMYYTFTKCKILKRVPIH